MTLTTATFTMVGVTVTAGSTLAFTATTGSLAAGVLVAPSGTSVTMAGGTLASGTPLWCGYFHFQSADHQLRRGFDRHHIYHQYVTSLLMSFLILLGHRSLTPRLLYSFWCRIMLLIRWCFRHKHPRDCYSSIGQ